MEIGQVRGVSRRREPQARSSSQPACTVVDEPAGAGAIEVASHRGSPTDQAERSMRTASTTEVVVRITPSIAPIASSRLSSRSVESVRSTAM